ncbi:disease resistance protein RUN1-like [Prosopis cineraria]|uniref:disease resistance protein RUN1-like n=1 Tax=Prosopis cineraria TaxID=364024 RepID=UPI00240F0D75|nr:disease resistance protein RUN1-like [Prosopis cineraria]
MTNGFVGLQRKLISKLKIRDLEVDDAYEGKNLIRNLFSNRKLLVVLDDVSEISQLENLSIKKAWFGSRSKVIVTTRNIQVLMVHGEFETYKAKLLNDGESLQLLCKRAFKMDKPKKNFLKLYKSVIHYAKGLPLTLEVLGSYLCGRSELEWNVALEKIKKFPPSSILKRLRISYDALGDVEKKIFLDIACFFKGMVKDQVMQIFEICGLYLLLAIRELVEKCLIVEYYFDYGTWCFGMHDILQEMGKSIILEQSPNDASKRSRLWSVEDIDRMMTNNKGSDMVEVIHLQSTMPYEMLEKMKFIDLSYSEDFSRTPNFFMLPNLEQLVLKGCIKLDEVHPSLGQLKKLVVLDLKDCKNLKALLLRMEMDSLNKLILSGCSKVKKLLEFGENMTNLFILDLKNCKNLVCLLRSTCNLKSLKSFNILGCSKFSTLPQNLNENKVLKELDLSITAIKDVPSSIIGLPNLKLLYLNGCKGLSSRSNSLGRSLLSPIRKIFGYDNEAPTRLVFPSFISSVVSLKELYLDDCNLKVGSILNDLGHLSSLELLSLSGNDFNNIPACNWLLSSLSSCPSSLKTLNICQCNLNDGSILEDLGFLPSLIQLGLLGNNFTHLPSCCIFNLFHLHTLHLSHCPRLKFLPNLSPNLQRIDTDACHSLQPLSFPELLLKCIAFANASMAYFSQSHVYNMELVFWWILGNEIPSWFYNQDFQVLDKIVGFQDNYIV